MKHIKYILAQNKTSIKVRNTVAEDFHKRIEAIKFNPKQICGI